LKKIFWQQPRATVFFCQKQDFIVNVVADNQVRIFFSSQIWNKTLRTFSIIIQSLLEKFMKISVMVNKGRLMVNQQWSYDESMLIR